MEGPNTYDKIGGRVEISATVWQAVDDAFQNAKALQMEGSQVVARGKAGARYVPRSYPRIVERERFAA